MTSTGKSSDSSQTAKAKPAAPAPAPGALTYNGYLKVDELKSLQVCQSAPPHHDEPLFIIIHQAYELWFKLILHELDSVFVMMKEKRVRRANFYMRRIIEILKLLVQQIHILETMSPRDFLDFRYNLSPASGFGSSQFREIEFAAGLKDEALLEHFHGDPSYEALLARRHAPSLEEAFYALLRTGGFELPGAAQNSSQEEQERLQQARIKQLVKLYTEEDNYASLHDLAESLLEFDEFLSLWRSNHVLVVERMIGFKRGTGGSEGVGYLQSTLTKRCFPDLWKLRTALEQAEGGAQSAQAAGCPFHSS